MFFIMTLALLSQCEKDEPTPVVNIPDNNFQNALIEEGVDTNGDGLISSEEAEAVSLLNVDGILFTNDPTHGIADLTGIEAFTYLDTLKCNNNRLTSLDVSANTALKYLACRNNLLQDYT